MRPGFDEDWPDDGRPSKTEIDRLLEGKLAFSRRRLQIWSFVALLGIGVAIGEFGKACGWW